MKSLEYIIRNKFEDGELLTAKKLNKLIFAIRDIQRKVSKKARKKK
jgi:hypothetical protein